MSLSSPSTPTSPAPEPYEIRIITKADSEVLLAHLRKFFFKDEPLNVAIRLIERENSTCPELEEYSLKSINEGTSLMAITNSNHVVGVCLNGTIKNDDADEADEDSTNAKFSKVRSFLHYGGMEGTKVIVKKFPDVEKIMFVKIISTDTAWRGKGIAKELMDRTSIHTYWLLHSWGNLNAILAGGQWLDQTTKHVNIGRKRGYGLMRVDCSSYFSARAIARLGFECIYELKYDDYTENGKPVFETEHPHTSFTVYVQRIS